MLPYRKIYEVVGYTQDGATVCADCWGDRPEPEKGNGGPVSLQDAEDLTCDECFARLDGSEEEETGGYTDCACRDCFDIAIGKAGKTLCLECKDAGCEADNGECQREDAYGCNAEEG